MTTDSGVPSKAVLLAPEIAPNVGGGAPEAVEVPTKVGTEKVDTEGSGMKILIPPVPKKSCRHCHGTGRIGHMPERDQFSGKTVMVPVRCRCVIPKVKK
jgi:hypothetical protein